MERGRNQRSATVVFPSTPLGGSKRPRDAIPSPQNANYGKKPQTRARRSWPLTRHQCKRCRKPRRTSSSDRVRLRPEAPCDGPPECVDFFSSSSVSWGSQLSFACRVPSHPLERVERGLHAGVSSKTGFVNEVTDAAGLGPATVYLLDTTELSLQTRHMRNIINQCPVMKVNRRRRRAHVRRGATSLSDLSRRIGTPG